MKNSVKQQKKRKPIVLKTTKKLDFIKRELKEKNYKINICPDITAQTSLALVTIIIVAEKIVIYPRKLINSSRRASKKEKL